MPAVARPRPSDARQYTSWDRARLSVVVPIGVIVAIAIICIVVAVLSSAQRADVVAADHEKQSFSRAINSFGERVLREVDSVASSDGAIQNIRRSFDSDWARKHVGMWLGTYFDHDYVFIFDRNDEPVYSMVGHRPADMKWLAAARPELAPVIDYMRGRDRHGCADHHVGQIHRRSRARGHRRAIAVEQSSQGRAGPACGRRRGL